MRNLDTYFEHISVQAPNTQKLARVSLTNFQRFKDFEIVIKEYADDENSLWDTLQPIHNDKSHGGSLSKNI